MLMSGRFTTSGGCTPTTQSHNAKPCKPSTHTPTRAIKPGLGASWSLEARVIDMRQSSNQGRVILAASRNCVR